jgi:hypothetical protein
LHLIHPPMSFPFHSPNSHWCQPQPPTQDLFCPLVFQYCRIKKEKKLKEKHCVFFWFEIKIITYGVSL